MDNRITIILELLSAGVIASLVAGIFSLVIAFKNNKRLVELEKSKQKFTVNQERYKGLREAYAELLNVLPEEKLLGHIIINLPSQKNFQENGLSEAYEAADMNMKIMYSHFQKHGYLLSDDEQKEIIKLIDVIDTITKSIIDISLGLQVYDVGNEENEDASVDKVHKKILERILKVTEFEETYYNLFKNNLSKDYKSESLLSLSGVYQPKKEMKDSKIPIALTTFLSANPQIKTIVLHLDNDKVGRLCTATLKELLQKDYKIVDNPPPVGKDFNDFLLSYLEIARPMPKRERSDAR